MAVALLASGCLLLLLELGTVTAGEGEGRSIPQSSLEVGTITAGEGRSVPQSSPQAFERWAARHGRSYGSAEERARRRAVYLENMAWIEAHNRGEDGGEGKGWRLGEGPFSDMTNEEFAAEVGAVWVPPTVGDLQGCADEAELAPHTDAPSLDWRAQGAVTPVKQQGACGACWSFAATGALEGAWKLFGPNHTLESLSEQQLLDCSAKNHGCDGGNPYYAFDYIRQNGGVDTEGDYPWLGKQGGCDGRGAARHVATVGAACTVARSDESALKKAVARQPIAVAMEGTLPSFQHYKSGILHQDGNCGDKINHAVLLIGYGVEASGAGGAGAVPYWIAKNSWGELWGEAGYVRIAQGENAPNGVCGVNEDPSYPVAGAGAGPQPPPINPKPFGPIPHWKPTKPPENGTECFAYYFSVFPPDAAQGEITKFHSSVDGRIVGCVLVLAGLLFAFVGVRFLKVLLAVFGLFLGGWAFLQAGLIVLPGMGVEVNELCLLATIALVIGALVGAALATVFAEVAVVTAGFVAGALLGYALFIAFLQAALANDPLGANLAMMACVSIPACICASFMAKYEHGLLIAVTAVLGGALLAKGLDSLVRPGGKEHLDVTTLTGHDLMTDSWLQAEGAVALTAALIGACVQRTVMRRKQRQRYRPVGEAPKHGWQEQGQLAAAAPPPMPRSSHRQQQGARDQHRHLQWDADRASGRFSTNAGGLKAPLLSY